MQTCTQAQASERILELQRQKVSDGREHVRDMSEALVRGLRIAARRLDPRLPPLAKPQRLRPADLGEGQVVDRLDEVPYGAPAIVLPMADLPLRLPLDPVAGQLEELV